MVDHCRCLWYRLGIAGPTGHSDRYSNEPSRDRCVGGLMPNEKLQTAVEQLNQYFNVSTKQDLVIELLKPTQPAVGSSITVPNDTDLGKIASLLVSVADGGLDSRGIIKEIDDFIKKNAAVGKLIDEKLMIFSKPDAAFVKDIGKVIGQ